MGKKRVQQRVGITALLLMLVAGLTGCGPSSAAQTSYLGFPPGVTASNFDVPHAFADGPTLYLTLGGSSSCPPVPTSLTNVDGVFEITVETGSAEACTADFVVSTHEINIGTVPDEVVLIFDNGDRQTLVVDPLEARR